MSLQEFPEILQGSDEWLDQRRGMLTASEMSGLITPRTVKVAANVEARSIFARLVAERITGWTDPTYVGEDMLRGIEDEPRARARYAETFAKDEGLPVTTTGFMVRTLDEQPDDAGEQIGYSPDGLVGKVGLIEVKSRRQDKHLATILADEVPVEFMAQIQTGLFVSGRDWCDYLSYSGGMPMWRKRVEPIPEWTTAILAVVTSFEVAAAELIETYHARVEGLPTTERIIYEEFVI